MAEPPKVTKFLAQLPIEEKSLFLDSFHTIQTDCDGVLWHLGDSFSGVDRAIRALRASEKKILFVSNNSVRTMEDYRKKLGKLTDFTVTDDDIIHPGKLIIQYLRDKKFGQALCYVIGSANLKKDLREAGFNIIDGPNDPVPETVAKIIPIINDKQPVKAVIVDFDFNCNNIKLLRAQLYLQHDDDCWFIAGAMDKSLPVGSRTRLIGPGWYIETLQNQADRKPIVLSKPGRDMSRLMRQLYPVEDTRRVLFIGDQPELDIKYGSLSGFQTLLVGTGGVKQADLKNLQHDQDLIPDYYIDEFASLEKIVLEVKAHKAQKNKSVL
ncbi:uncharacterized protein LOC131205533 [Anopheles bellator]|uniref:uncharacterized protein LOC131205533 n=1 Tax=Anopheles bellator TaxID=139047 RepID=UPI0026486C03|nr:uncharacterized protein LOC131205533 [Anopheles bellator]